MYYYRVLERKGNGGDGFESDIFTSKEEGLKELHTWIAKHTIRELDRLDSLYLARYNTREEAEEAYCDHDVIKDALKNIRKG